MPKRYWENWSTECSQHCYILSDIEDPPSLVSMLPH